MSKPATTAGAKGLVPKLRFPEFRHGGAWSIKPVGAVYQYQPTNSLSRDALNYDGGRTKNIHYGDIHTKFSTLFDITRENAPYINGDKLPQSIASAAYCAEGDMVFADASEDMEDIGKGIELVNLAGERVVAGQHTILARQKQKSLVIGFGGYLFKSQYVRTGVRHQAQGAKVLGISPTRLSLVELAFPPQHAEQQKIADCLSSLDDVIAAHADKLAALKQHKQGLVELLFPREGETVPRLRFPEFRGHAGWQPMALNNFIDEYRLKSSTQDEYEVLTSSRRGLIRQTEYYGGDGNRLTERDNIGFNVIPPHYLTYRSRSDDGTFHFNENVLWITGIVSIYYPVFQLNGMDHTFFLAVTWNDRNKIGSYSIGTSQKVLSLNQLRSFRFRAPAFAEQQQIGHVLASVDNLIAAESDKLAVLKQHKQGLLQQLFPTLDDNTQQ